MTRAVVDTNLVVSAFLWGGNPRAILDAARRETLTLFTSAALIAELEDVLSRAKFASRIAAVGSSVDEMLGDYLALAQLVRPTEHPAVVRDPDDDQRKPRSSSRATTICSRWAATATSTS